MAISEEVKNAILNKVKKRLEKITPPLVAKLAPDNNSYEVIGNIPVPYGSKKTIVPGMYFASIVKRKDTVVFYFLPCYMNAKILEAAPSLVKCLKGKTCFHFKKEEEVNEKELDLLLKKGLDAWKKAGYVN